MQHTNIPALVEKDVHLWLIPLERKHSFVDGLAKLLDDEETARVEKFRSEQLRRRFIVSHGRLREILGVYADKSPKWLSFTYQNGKPSLKDCKFEFNLSHSHEMAALAITRGIPIGIDIEKVRPIPNYLEIAQRFFTEDEVRKLRNSPATDQLRTFFLVWTHKEARAKATGEGLFSSSERHTADEKPKLIHTFCQADYVGAICIDQHSFANAKPTEDQVEDILVQTFTQ